MSSSQLPAGPPTPPAAGRILWLLALVLALASAWCSLALLAATWDHPDPGELILVVLAVAAGGAGVAGSAGMAAGGIVARLEARTAPLLPERARWLQLGAARAIAGCLAGGLLWAPAHALGILLVSDHQVERHFLLAFGSLLLYVPWLAAVAQHRRQGRALAAREPAGVASVSKLDRVPSVVWLALLVGSLAALPTGLGAALVVATPQAAVGMAMLWAFGAGFAGVLALVGRVGLFDGIGRDDPGSRGLAAVAGAFGPVWLTPYAVVLAAGGWASADDDVHRARLFVAVVCATAMVIAVAAVAWARTGPARAGADAR